MLIEEHAFRYSTTEGERFRVEDVCRSIIYGHDISGAARR